MSNKNLKNKSNLKKKQEYSINETTINKENNRLVVSFSKLDRNQGQTFEEWEKENLLLPFLNTIRDYSEMPFQELLNNNLKFKQYGFFPPVSNFKKPIHIDNNVNWSSMHINGKCCVGGYLYENTFYIVFLDKNHEFWISQKKHT